MTGETTTVAIGATIRRNSIQPETFLPSDFLPELPAPMQPGRPRHSARPGRGSGRGVAPQLRPVVGAPAPALGRRRAAPRVRGGCAGVAGRSAQVADAGAWRLTDRGIAVVLTVVAMIAVSAITVVGLTALRVTGESYSPVSVSVAH